VSDTRFSSIAGRAPLRAVIFCLLAATANAQSTLPTEEVFKRFSNRVVKIEVEEKGSSAKSSLGSGFYVTARGHVITNYHVVSELVHHPERYTARALESEDRSSPLELLDVDVTHDLAVLKAESFSGAFFSLVPIEPPQGLRLYSMGHPLDLGLNIVEGVYNGFLQHAFDKRINFSGSLNPGMSGGPAITAGGEVVGINVASAGEQVSFLVPVSWALALLESTTASDFKRPDPLLDRVRDQMLEWQESYLKEILQNDPPTIQLGSYQLPTRPAPFFNCWGDSRREKNLPYETIDHQCSTDDYIYVTPEVSSGRVRFYHRLLTTSELNRFQFASLYTSDFAGTYHGMEGDEDEVTAFRCHTGTVAQNSLTLKTVFCLRRYQRLEGVYDAVFKAAAVGKPLSGLETALFLSGVSYENAVRAVRWYLGAVSWAE
jgi:serine protease Do